MRQSRTHRGTMRDDPRRPRPARWLALSTNAAIVLTAHLIGSGTPAGASEIIAPRNSSTRSIHLTSAVPPARLAASVVAFQGVPPNMDLIYDPNTGQFNLRDRSTGQSFPAVYDQGAGQWVPASSSPANAAQSFAPQAPAHMAPANAYSYHGGSGAARQRGLMPMPSGQGVAPSKPMPAAVAPGRMPMAPFKSLPQASPAVPSKSMPAAAPSRQAGY
jgi:hypothetical protein